LDVIVAIVVGAAQGKIEVARILCPGVHAPARYRDGWEIPSGADDARNLL
jgi:hypothetical protein